MAVQAVEQADPFLSGNFAPVVDELDAGELPVTGELPRALHGAYLRNGANPAFAPMGAYHWFDGDGMIHAVHLEDGQARYKNRYVRTLGLDLERQAGRALFGGLNNFVIPDGELFMQMGGPFKNAANTNIVEHAGKILALWEGGFPHELTPELETVGLYDFCGKLAGAMTAHPKMDAETGEMLFFGYSQFPPYLRYHVVDAAGALVRSVDIDLPAGVMIHDFVITADYAVFLDAPARFNLEAVVNGEPGIKWDPDAGCRIGVMPRDGDVSKLRWFEVDPCFVFHFMNAWTEGDKVFVDGARFPRLAMPGDALLAPGEADETVALSRFTVDLAAGRAGWEPLDDRSIEFPRIDDRLTGRKNRYGYAPGFSPASVQFDQLLKYDLQTGAADAYAFPAGQSTGEAVFVPDPDGRAEDDGWLVSFVHDGERDGSDFVVIDARDVAAGPVARVHLPRRVPFGFHGNWVPGV